MSSWTLSLSPDSSPLRCFELLTAVEAKPKTPKTPNTKKKCCKLPLPCLGGAGAGHGAGHLLRAPAVPASPPTPVSISACSRCLAERKTLAKQVQGGLRAGTCPQHGGGGCGAAAGRQSPASGEQRGRSRIQLPEELLQPGGRSRSQGVGGRPESFGELGRESLSPGLGWSWEGKFIQRACEAGSGWRPRWTRTPVSPSPSARSCTPQDSRVLAAAARGSFADPVLWGEQSGIVLPLGTR